mgnify:CR=1 FL=1
MTTRTSGSMSYGSVIFGIEGYIPIIEDRLVLIPQLYGSMLFGKGAYDGASDGWNPLFKGPVPAYPSLNNVIGVMFDRDAMGYNIYNDVIETSPYNAKGQYYNMFAHMDIQLQNDLTEKAVVLYLD